jgi:drug/metabolite transporter (DMT)-like permease
MKSSPYLTLVLAVVFVSCGSILVRLAEAPALAVAFYRVLLASLFVAPFAARDAGRAWESVGSRRRLLLGAAGVALALHFATWIASLSFTSVASSVLLVNTAPMFAVGLSRILLGERVSGTVLAAIGLAFVGAALIALGDWKGSPGSLLGNLLAVAGAVALAAYHVAGRGLRDALPLNAYILIVWSAAAMTLGVLVLLFGTPLEPYGPRNIACFVGLALVPTVLGHGLVNRALRSFPAPTVGLFLLGEPLGASALAYLVFGETPGASTLGGGLLVLAALVLVVTRRS